MADLNQPNCAVESGSVASVDLSHLPDWLLANVDSCPPAGSGVHFFLFGVARQLYVHLSEEEIFVVLKSKVAGCGRPVSGLVFMAQSSSSCDDLGRGAGAMH